MRITSYCLDWHLSASDSSRKILVEPVAPAIEVVERAWDGVTVPDPLPADRPTIFYMLPPPPDIRGDAVWIPMWDQARGFPASWWDTIPKHVRVVALSREVERRARAAGLQTLGLQFFLDPAEVSPVAWDAGVIVFYWNRTGLLSPTHLAALCRAVGASELLFRADVDPGVSPDVAYELGAELEGIPVTPVTATGRDEYLQATSRANVFVAPRVSEGVGMTFLEAMARGSAVVAFDAPTMSEYIQSGRNGLLIAGHTARRFLSRHRGPFQLTPVRPWPQLDLAGLRALGDQAAHDHRVGHERWSQAVNDYRSFLLGTDRRS